MADNHQITEGSGSTFKSTETAGIKTPHSAISTSTGVPLDLNTGAAGAATLRVVTAPDTRQGANGDASSKTGSNAAQMRFLADLIDGTAGTRQPTDARLIASAGLPLDLNAGVTGAQTLRVANANDPVAVTGTISAADVGSVTTVTSAGQSLITGTPTASSFVSTAVSARSSCTIQITGTFVGTIAVERSIDGGATWVGARMVLDGGESAIQSVTTQSVASINTAGRTTIRARAIAWTSGSAAIVLLPSVGVSLIRSDQVTTASLLFRTQALTSTPQQVKNANGKIVGWNIYNPNTVPSFIKLYDSASPTVGTTTPLDAVAIPAFSSFVIKESTGLYAFTTALSIAATSGSADSNNVTPILPLNVSIYYV